MNAAKNWAQALFEIALERGCVQNWQQKLVRVRASLEENPEFLRLLSEPILTRSQRTELLERCFSGAVAPEILNCLRLMCARGLGRQIPHCAEEFVRLWEAHCGAVRLSVTSAVELDARQRRALLRTLRKKLNRPLQMEYHTDASLLGGVKLEYEGKTIDATVRSRLQTARRILLRRGEGA